MNLNEKYQLLHDALEQIAHNEPCPSNCNHEDESCCALRGIYCARCLAWQTLVKADADRVLSCAASA